MASKEYITLRLKKKRLSRSHKKLSDRNSDAITVFGIALNVNLEANINPLPILKIAQGKLMRRVIHILITTKGGI